MTNPETPYERNDRLMKELAIELDRWAAEIAVEQAISKGREGRRSTDRLAA